MLWYPVCVEHMNAPSVAAISEFAPRTLFTAYPFIFENKNLDSFKFIRSRMGKRHVLMDSGIYTLYRDSWKGTKRNKKMLLRSCEKYINMILDTGYKHPFIEFDVHYFIKNGGKEVWDFRNMFIDAGLQDQTLFVWHLPEGHRAFRELCERFPRVSASTREFQARKIPLTAFTALLKTASDLLPEKHIHCLGTTNNRVTCQPDNFSSDTSSWNSLVLYGETKAGKVTLRFKGGKLYGPKTILDSVDKHLDRMIRTYRAHPFTKPRAKIRVEYLRALGAALYIHVNHMESLRKKTPNTDMSIVDPIEYSRKGVS